jgi:hypothetical protein
MDETLYGTDLPELARDEFLLPDKITMKIPPILMVDESKFAIHSEIPRKGDIGTGESTPEPPEQLRSTEPLPTPDIVPIQPKSGTDSAHASEQTQTPTKPEDTLLTEYKLLRAYDFNVQPGKTYVYRVQVWLEDPNHPQQELTDKMRERPFAPSVIQRLMDVAEKEKTQNRRIWYRESPWSEPSEPVSVPQLSTMLAGGVTPGRSTTINGVEVELDPLTGQLLQVEWDRQRAVPAAGLLNVYRGSSLEATVDVDVMKPIDQELVTVKNYHFQGDGVVVDMRGGRKLPTSIKDTVLHSPGEFAVVDQQGNLQVQNELDDMARYRRYLFLDAIDENRFSEVNREPSEEGGAHELLDGHGLLDSRDEREREPRSRGR